MGPGMQANTVAMDQKRNLAYGSGTPKSLHCWVWRFQSDVVVPGFEPRERQKPKFKGFYCLFFKKHRRARQKCNALPEPSEINHFNVAGASGAVNRTGRAAHDQTHGKDVLLRLFDRVAANGFRYQLRRHGADFSNRLADGGK